MMRKVLQVSLLALVSGYKLKQNQSALDFPLCEGLPLQGPTGGQDEWQCDNLGGELGTTDEFKCTHRYDAGVDGKVYLQCQVHPKTEKLFNCLASKRCIPNGDVKFAGNRCHCDPSTGVAAAGETCKVNHAYECESCLAAFYLAPDKHCKKKLCTCAFGTPAAGADCPIQATAHCASCDSDGGYTMDLDGKTCIEKQCTCAEGTGTAARGKDCPSHHLAKCKSCDAGYIFGADGSTCKMKQCTCLLDGKNAGEGASGISCDTDGMNKCASCNDAAGFAMDPAGSNTCITKRCLCTAGTGAPATGAACESHQANKCISCNTDGGFKMGDDGKTCVCDAGRGFEAADNTCVYKDCSCANGRKAVGVDCPKHLSTKCLSCEAGYRLVKDQCLKNVCTCPDGTAVFGAACDVHDKHQCTTCDKGYELIDGKCVYKICDCPSGTRAEGEDCPKHGDTMCAACDAGFRFKQGKAGCKQNVCTCHDGAAATGADCVKHDEHNCASCKGPGYEIIDKKCVFKVCDCSLGKRAEGADCPAHGDKKCVSCDAGYHLDNGACVANSCSCSNGQAVGGTDCSVHEAHKCSSCDKGYQLIDDKCTWKVCKCANGKEAEGDDCRCHECKTCKSCDAGFRRKKVGKNHLCRANSCTCSDGKAVTGADCDKHKANKCASCDDGYELSSDSCSLRTCTCSNGKGKTGSSCPKQGEEDCQSCTTTGYELTTKNGRSVCTDPIAVMQAVLAKKQSEERTAVAWGDPHVKVFDYKYSSKEDRFTNFHQGWGHSNLNTMEPGTYWLVKTPDNLVSIQGVYGWGWRAVIRRLAVSGAFIRNDRITVHPLKKDGKREPEKGVYYQYAGEKRKQIMSYSGKFEWNNNRKDVNIKYHKTKEGLVSKKRLWRVKMTLPLFVELIINIYKHHVDVVVTMRPIDGMWGDMGNSNGDSGDEMKWNPSNVKKRNPYWYQMTTAHGTQVDQSNNIFPSYYAVPKAPKGAKTTALLETNKSNETDPDAVVVDGVTLENHEHGTENAHDCTPAEKSAAQKLCHEMFKVNNSVQECVVDVCQQGPRMAEQAEIVEDEVEESEEEESAVHYQIYAGGRLYHSCFHAEEHFTQVAAMPRDERELGLIKALAGDPTLLGGRCAGDKWVYLDGTRVPEAVISSSCTNGQLLCVQGGTVSACDGAQKIACQIPRLYTCKADVTLEELLTACPGGMQPAEPKSVRDLAAAQDAMDSESCTTKQAWTGYSRGPNEQPQCFEEGKTTTQTCDNEPKRTVMCETKFT